MFKRRNLHLYPQNELISNLMLKEHHTSYERDRTMNWCEVCFSMLTDEGADDVQVCSIRSQVRVCTVTGK